MIRGNWFDAFVPNGNLGGLSAEAREALARVDTSLFEIWNLGENVLLNWTHADGQLMVLPVRHYAIPEAVHLAANVSGGAQDSLHLINALLAGPKYLPRDEFMHVCAAFDIAPRVVPCDFSLENDNLVGVINDMVRRYSVSLVRNRAVVLLDAVEFSLRSPLDQMAMLNSLAYSVNSAYAQLLSKDININFARTTTGDGFYVWNRETRAGSNAELYKLMMMILADNAVARHKARSQWVPNLRAAFHIGEHYEFHQVEGLNPTQFSYIVGQVTVDLARMVEHARPGQILLGEFRSPADDGGSGRDAPGAVRDTRDFVADTASTLAQLNGLDLSGGRIASIHCYLTGRGIGGGRHLVSRYRLRDKHGSARTVYNAKINIHRIDAAPVFMGLRDEDLAEFSADGAVSFDGEQ